MAITFTKSSVIKRSAGNTHYFDENQDNEVVLGTFTGLTLPADSYRISTTAGHAAFYKLVVTNGVLELRVANKTGLNFESLQGNIHAITIEAGTGSGRDAMSLSLNLEDVNEAPTGIRLRLPSTTTDVDSVTINENMAPGRLGSLRLQDPDDEQGDYGRLSAYWQIDPASPYANLFEIEEVTASGITTYHLRVKGTIDYESLPDQGAGQDRWIDLPIIGRDNYGNVGSNSITQNIRIIVRDVGETPTNTAPTDISLSNAAVAEDRTGGHVIGTLSATDAQGGAMAYTIVNDPDSKFAIVNGQLVVRSGATFNFEGKTSHDVRVQVTDSGNLTYEKTLTITVDNVNEGPLAWLNTAGNTQVSLQENRPLNHPIAQLGATDPDGNHPQWSGPFTYRIDTADPTTSTYAHLYDVVNNGGVWTLVVKGQIDYDSLPADQKRHTIKIITRDNAGAEGGQLLVINLTNDPSDVPTNQPPQIGNTAAQVDVADNGGAAKPFGNVTITDNDTTTPTFTATVTFTGGAGALTHLQNVGTLTGSTYTVNGTREYVEAALQGLAFNPNDNPNGAVGAVTNTTFTLSVTDGSASAPPVTTTVRSIVSNRAPTSVTFADNTDAVTVQENGTANRVVGTLKGVDSNQNDTFTYEIVGQNSLFSISGNELHMVGTLDYEAGGYQTDGQGRYYVVQVRARDQGGNGVYSDPVNLKVYVTDDTSDNNVAPTLAVNTSSFTSTGGAVNPFTGLVAADVNTSDELTLTIRYTRDNGTFEGLTDRDGVTANVADSGTQRTITLKGTAAALNAYLDGVSFDPINTASTTTNFIFTIKDDQSPVQTINAQVTVTSTINGNAPPVIEDVPTQIQTFPDRGALVQPFTGIDISDTGSLTVVVKMDTATKGKFLNVGNHPYNEQEGYVTITGDATQVTAALNALQFDPRDKAAGSPAETTTFTITVTDANNATASETLQVSATAPNAPPANRAPTDLALSNVTIQELAKNGTSLATLSAKDADGDSLTYKIVLANGAAVDTDGSFTVSGNQLLVSNGVLFDAEQAKTKQITLEVSDGRGGTARQTFTINVSDKSREVMAASDASPFNDIIKGSKTGNFKDTFYGGAGDDKLWGGYGNDTLWGGTGKDVFVFDGKLGTSTSDRRVNYDTIKDYSVKDDSIWLEGDLFKSNKALYAKIKKGTELAPKKLESKFFTVGDKAKDRDDYFVYDAKKRVLYYDADGSGSKAAIEMATFTNNKALKNFKATELFFI